MTEEKLYTLIKQAVSDAFDEKTSKKTDKDLSKIEEQYNQLVLALNKLKEVQTLAENLCKHELLYEMQLSNLIEIAAKETMQTINKKLDYMIEKHPKLLII